MAILPDNNIGLDTIGQAISDSSRVLNDLNRSANINRWAKHKPVKGSWPTADGGKYGILILSNWSYTQPTENYRILDWRGYLHDAKPVIYMDTTNEPSGTDLYPTGSPQSLSFIYSLLNTPATGEMTPADIGVTSYYFCIKVVTDDNTWYKSFGLVPSSGDTKTIILSAEITDSAVYTYLNMPSFTGASTVYFGISDTEQTAWTTTAPTNFQILPDQSLVTGSLTVFTSHSITIHDWVVLDPTSLTFPGKGYTYKTSDIDTSLDNWELISKPSWVDVTVYQSGSQVTNSALWATNMTLHVVPNSDNTSGSDRSGNIEVGEGSTVMATLSVTQTSCTDPYVQVTTTDFSADNKSGSVSYGSTNLTYTLKPTDVGIHVLCDVVLKKNGTQVDTDTVTLSDNDTYNGSFTLADAADCGDAYVVEISKS